MGAKTTAPTLLGFEDCGGTAPLDHVSGQGRVANRFPHPVSQLDDGFF